MHRTSHRRPRRRHPLSTLLEDEWRTLRRRSAVVARARGWGVTEQPFADLDELLAHAGYGRENCDDANAVLRRLVDVAHRDELATRVVLQRLLPGLLAIVRRRHDDDQQGSLEELIGAACLAVQTYRTDARPQRVAANLVRDASYRAFTAPRRRRSATEIAIDPHSLDETPAVIVLSSGEELALLLAEARAAGIDPQDLDLARALLHHGSAALVAAEREVTPRTIRNHRDRTVARLRQVAFAAA